MADMRRSSAIQPLEQQGVARPPELFLDQRHPTSNRHKAADNDGFKEFKMHRSLWNGSHHGTNFRTVLPEGVKVHEVQLQEFF